VQDTPGAGAHDAGALPNPYEDSLCQETHYSPERCLVIFFRLSGPGVISIRCHVLA